MTSSPFQFCPTQGVSVAVAGLLRARLWARSLSGTTSTPLKKSRCWSGRWERRTGQQDGRDLHKAVQSRVCVGRHIGGAQEVRSFLQVAFERSLVGPSSSSSKCGDVAGPEALDPEPPEGLFEEREVTFKRQSPDRLGAGGGGNSFQHAPNEIGNPSALEQNVLAGRGGHESPSLGLPDSHNPKGVGVALVVGGTEGHKVTPPAGSGFNWSQETAKLQKIQKCERHMTREERSDGASERHAEVHKRADLLGL